MHEAPCACSHLILAWAPSCHWVAQISFDYFENAMAHFTATIYNAIKARPALHLYPCTGIAETLSAKCSTTMHSCRKKLRISTLRMNPLAATRPVLGA